MSGGNEFRTPADTGRADDEDGSEMNFPTRQGMLLATAAVLMLGACRGPLDFDLRGGPGVLNTSDAARNATATRPKPDERGIISYPGYQVAVAQRGDTIESLAARIGADPAALARFNGIKVADPLRQGEIIALPERVPEPEGGPIRPPGGVDINAIAGNAIDEADSDDIETTALDPARTGVQPVRHKVARGETAYTIARLYDVSVRGLADWNGLGADFAVREGQHLLIPVSLPESEEEAGAPLDATGTGQTALPGTGTTVPDPPSADDPLPEEETMPPGDNATVETEAPDLSGDITRSGENSARMMMPVRGDIVREYSKGKNEGIDIAASPGTAVNAADDGVVAAITEDTRGIPIIVMKHDDNILTVYSNVGAVAVEKGESLERGAKLAEIREDGSATMHFEVRDGFESVDPSPYLE